MDTNKIKFSTGSYLTRNNKTAIVKEIVAISEDNTKCWDETNTGMYYLIGEVPGYGNFEWDSEGKDISDTWKDPQWDLVSTVQ